METFLVLNGYEICASVDEQEMIILKVASGELARKEFTHCIRGHMVGIDAH